MTFDASDPTQVLAALNALNDQISALTAANAALTQPSQPTKEPKITLPDKFDGSRSAYRGFSNQVKLAFQMAPTRYATDSVKIATVGSLLKGDALAWYNPFIEKPDRHAATLATWVSFLSAMDSAFSDPDQEKVAEHKIRRLAQGRSSASTYAAKFKQLASDLNWNEAALISQFRSGLSDSLKDMLVFQDPEPKEIEAFLNLVIRLDNRIFEREQDRKRADAPPRPMKPQQQSTATPTLQPIQMDIDAVSSRRRGPLSQEERTRRAAEGLCFYCGLPGHIANNCGNRRGHVAAVSTTNAAGADQDF